MKRVIFFVFFVGLNVSGFSADDLTPFVESAKEKYAEGDYNAARDLAEEILKRQPQSKPAKEILEKSRSQLQKLAKEAFTTGSIMESFNRLAEAKQYWNRALLYTREGDAYYGLTKEKLEHYF